jgi:uncharacterized protein YdeI (YjbR/CyaY-like superfamily)
VKPVLFQTPAAFREWLEENHGELTEIWVRFYKVKSGKGGMVYAQALDEALCYGWIDGIVRSLDEESYVQRFTPRRKGSTWSAINIEKVKGLEAAGRMRPSGRAAFERRDEAKSLRYSFERQEVKFPPAYERKLRASGKAWKFFSAQPPSYRRAATWWVISAKKDETRERRLLKLVAKCEAGERMY